MPNYDQTEWMYAAYLEGARQMGASRPVDRKAFDKWLEKQPGYSRGRFELTRNGNFASVERILSRETKVEVFAAGAFDEHELREIVQRIQHAGDLTESLLSEQELSDLQKVRSYFWDRRFRGSGEGTEPITWNANASEVLAKVIAMHSMVGK